MDYPCVAFLVPDPGFGFHLGPEAQQGVTHTVVVHDSLI